MTYVCALCTIFDKISNTHHYHSSNYVITNACMVLIIRGDGCVDVILATPTAVAKAAVGEDVTVPGGSRDRVPDVSDLDC